MLRSDEHGVTIHYESGRIRMPRQQGEFHLDGGVDFDGLAV